MRQAETLAQRDIPIVVSRPDDVSHGRVAKPGGHACGSKGRGVEVADFWCCSSRCRSGSAAGAGNVLNQPGVERLASYHVPAVGETLPSKGPQGSRSTYSEWHTGLRPGDAAQLPTLQETASE